MRLLIDTDGRVIEANVLESTDNLLNDAAIAAILKSRFSPAQRGGRGVKVWVLYEFHFAGQTSTPAQPPLDDTTNTFVPLPPVGKPINFAHKQVQRDKEIRERTDGISEEVVVITGARVPERARDAAVATEVIDRDEIEESRAENLGEILFARPGIQMQKSFGGTELWMRGLDPRYSLVLIDGMRPAGRIGGALDLSRFMAERIESVEIVRGPSSALYGSEAIGGVVNMISRESESPLEVDATMRLGTDEMYSGAGRIAGRPWEYLGLEATAGRQHSPGFTRRGSYQTAGSEQQLDSLSGAFNLGVAKNNRLSARLDYSLNDLKGVDLGAGDAIFDRHQQQEQIQSSLRYRVEHGKFFLLTGLSYSRFREQTLKDQRDSDALDSYEDSREHLSQLSSTADYHFNRSHRTTGGAEVLVQSMISPRLDGSANRTRYSAFAQHRMALFSAQRQVFVIVPGARLDTDSQFGSQLSPKFVVRYQPISPWIFRAGYGRGFRAPSFQQLLLNFENASVGYVVEGNPSLSAEKAHSIDLSVAYQPDNSLRFFVAGFRNDLTDMIAVVTAGQNAGGTVFSYDNLSSAYTQGIESQVVYEPFSSISLVAGYTLTDTWDEEHKHKIEGQAPHLLTARIRLEHEESELLLDARSTISVGRPYYPLDTVGSDDVIVAAPLSQLDLRVAKKFGPQFELFIGIQNVLNAGDEYAELLPRQYYSGLRGRYF